MTQQRNKATLTGRSSSTSTLLFNEEGVCLSGHHTPLGPGRCDTDRPLIYWLTDQGLSIKSPFHFICYVLLLHAAVPAAMRSYWWGGTFLCQNKYAVKKSTCILLNYWIAMATHSLCHPSPVLTVHDHAKAYPTRWDRLGNTMPCLAFSNVILSFFSMSYNVILNITIAACLESTLYIYTCFNTTRPLVSHHLTDVQKSIWWRWERQASAPPHTLHAHHQQNSSPEGPQHMSSLLLTLTWGHRLWPLGVISWKGATPLDSSFQSWRTDGRRGQLLVTYDLWRSPWIWYVYERALSATINNFFTVSSSIAL